MTNTERFNSLVESINREGIPELLEWLGKSDFYSAPASTRFHNACPGGLLEHSLNVYDELLRLLKAYPEISKNVSEGSAKITALFHDLCKADMYTTEQRNRKTPEGRWESYTAYSINEKFAYGGHGSKSVYLLSRFLKLTPEEATAVNCHMGAWDGNEYVGKAFEQFPLAWILHVADESATYVRENIK